jgi:hypothetical protein
MRFRILQLLALTSLAAACCAAFRFIEVGEAVYFWIAMLSLPALAFVPLYLRDMLRKSRKKRTLTKP